MGEGLKPCQVFSSGRTILGLFTSPDFSHVFAEAVESGRFPRLPYFGEKQCVWKASSAALQKNRVFALLKPKQATGCEKCGLGFLSRVAGHKFLRFSRETSPTFFISLRRRAVSTLSGVQFGGDPLLVPSNGSGYLRHAAEKFAPFRHQLAPPVEHVAALVGGLYLAADGVRQGNFRDFARRVCDLGRPIPER
jgi:hypothetical protein